MRSSVRYDRSALIGAVGPSVWAKLGPEDWFDNYKMIIANSRGYEADYIINLGMHTAGDEGLKTQNIINSLEFMETTQNLPDYKFIVYRPIIPPKSISQDRFIANDISMSRYENKKVFRDIFADKVPIAPFESMAVSDFVKSSAGMMYSRFMAEFGDKFVIQDSELGGGVGTFIVESAEDVGMAMQVLSEVGKGGCIIVSKFISGRERSIQVFTSQRYTLPGPLQQQLVRNRELLNPDEHGIMHFCGGRLVFDESNEVIEQIRGIVNTVATELQSAGYTGIFGLDFMIDESNRVYVLEVNARTTGLLPLLNEQSSAVPLYLLNILELARLPYEIHAEPQDFYIGGPRSFVVLFNQTGMPARLDDSIETGNYVFTNGILQQIDKSARWNTEADCMIQLFASSDFLAIPNAKFCNIFLKNDGFDSAGVLNSKARQIVGYLKERIIK